MDRQKGKGAMDWREKQVDLVFPGPVRSGYGVSSNPNRDRDQLAWVPELKKTGPNHE